MYEVNQKTLAEALGISSRQVRNLKEQGMFEFISDTKKYDLTKCVSEYIEFKVKSEVGSGTSIIKEKEQAEHERLKKEITKIKLRKIRKETHEAADVEAFWTEMLLNFRARLLSVPSKIAPQILGLSDINVIIKLLDDEMLGTLSELAEYDPDVVNGENSNGYQDYDEDDEEEI